MSTAMAGTRRQAAAFDSELGDVYRAAVAYVSGGMSVIPLLLDGTKAPALRPGEPQIYSERLPTIEELKRWFRGDRHGIGLKCGAVSGGLEVIDFDMLELLEPTLCQLGRNLRLKLSVYETPGGWHVIYRCREICGNRKIASWEKSRSLSQRDAGYRDGTALQSIGKGVRIESRGEGGYVVAEGSPASVHASGRLYAYAMGPALPDVEVITPDERRELWQAAASFDCGEFVEHKRIRDARRKLYAELHPRISTGDEPWDWFDRHGDPEEILRAAGWDSLDNRHWTRPGKDRGTSAMLGPNEEGLPIFTVFSTSAGPLSPRAGESTRSFGPFSLLTALQFAGDRGRAASHVRKELMQK